MNRKKEENFALKKIDKEKEKKKRDKRKVNDK